MSKETPTFTVEQELWNVFTFYTLHGNQKDPSKLNRSGLFKICRDIRILDPTMTEHALTQADIDLIFTSGLKSPSKKHRSTQTEKSDKLDYDEFLTCFIRIAEKCYPSCHTQEDALQQLLMDNVLPLALRRKPVDVTGFIVNSSIQSLFLYYEDALLDLFKYFATNSDHSTKVRNMMRSTSTNTKSFDEHKELIQEARELSKMQNAFANMMSYSDFLRFGAEFGLSTMGLTTLDLGDIYLSVIDTKSFDPTVRKIIFSEFWETLVRCAITAFKDLTIPTEDKLKGMFLYIWRHLQSSVQDEISGIGTLARGGFNTYKGGLLRGSQILNERFISQWTKDNYRDYLDASTAPALVATKVPKSNPLIQLLSSGPTEAASASTTSAVSPRSNNGLASSSAVSTPKSKLNRPAVILEMGRLGENGDLGDERIKAHALRSLLQARPDIAKLLLDCIKDAGLDDLSSDEED